MTRVTELLVVVFMLLLLVSCGIDTQPMHKPIYPEAGVDVTYTISVRGDGGIKNVTLYHIIRSDNANLTMPTTNELVLFDTNLVGTPSTANITFTKIGGYNTGDEITYRFEVKTRWGQTRSHDVTFGIQPYLRKTFTPIYVQGEPNEVADIVFIPDDDIPSLNDFYDNCSRMIKEVFFADPTLRKWSRQFNFYVHHYSGTATDHDNIETQGPHRKPDHWGDISFAEMKIIMHDKELRDYATNLDPSLCSAEQEYSGTVKHEAGHALFGLSDEYGPDGYHVQEEILPNNWGFLAIIDLQTAQEEAKKEAMKASISRHKTPFDVQLIYPTQRWCKICKSSCQMKHADVWALDYDAPCADRVVHCIKENAYGMQNGGE
jgi:hypothetical protein